MAAAAAPLPEPTKDLETGSIFLKKTWGRGIAHYPLSLRIENRHKLPFISGFYYRGLLHSIAVLNEAAAQGWELVVIYSHKSTLPLPPCTL